MPFKSKAQQRYMFAAEERGELPKGNSEQWAKETKNIKKLPKKVRTRRQEKASELNLRGLLQLMAKLKQKNKGKLSSLGKSVPMAPIITHEDVGKTTSFFKLISALYSPNLGEADRRKLLGRLKDRAVYGSEQHPHVGIPPLKFLTRLLGGIGIPKSLEGEE